MLLSKIGSSVFLSKSKTSYSREVLVMLLETVAYLFVADVVIVVAFKINRVNETF